MQHFGQDRHTHFILGMNTEEEADINQLLAHQTHVLVTYRYASPIISHACLVMNGI